MAAPSLDREFMQYWEKLSLVEKESLLHVAKNYVQLKAPEQRLDEARKVLVQAERDAYLKGEGESKNWDEVKALCRKKALRNGL